MKLNKLFMALLTISFIATLFLFPTLPASVPIHWNIKGEIDNYGSKYYTIFSAALPIIIYLSMLIIPKIDPKRASYEKHIKSYSIVSYLLTLFLVAVHWVTVGVAAGFKLSIPLIIGSMMGILFIILGNYMRQIRPNYTFGIRTPWTLDNEIVWKKTHNIGSTVFIIDGLIMTVSVFINAEIGFIVSMAALFISMLFIFIYSYLVHRNLTRSAK